MPVLEEVEQAFLLDGPRALCTVPRVGRCVPVDLAVRQVLGTEHGTPTPPLSPGQLIGQRRVDVCDSAPRAQASSARWTITQRHGPDDRAETIGTDDHVPCGLALVGERESDAAAFLRQGDASAVEPDRVLVDRGDQRRMQRSAVDHDQRGTEVACQLIHGRRVQNSPVGDPGSLRR